jgi:beta-phosphoglucomutase-like phosphatase (HAD superfamily)
LREARAQGLRLAIATTTSLPNVTSLLSSTLGAQGAGWFAIIGAGDVVAAKKPAPDIYQWTLERLGLSGEHCLAFEDSDNGLRSALGAGIRATVVTVNEYTADQDFTGAALVVDHLGDPGQPCTVLQGRLEGEGLIQVDDLRRLCYLAQ